MNAREPRSSPREGPRDRSYAEPLDVISLARQAHVSPYHFSRRFKEAFGETPHSTS